MECMEAIKGRRSVRKFKEDAIEEKVITELLEAAQMAPSAGNLQARDFVVVMNRTLKQKLKEAALNQSFIEEAPVVIVVVANIERSSRVYKVRGELYAIQDATAAVMNLLLAAHSKGLGTCWVGAFEEYIVHNLLGLPDNTKPVAIIPVGYPDEKPVAPPKIGLNKITHQESW